jgi:hypothetical protein
MIELLRNKNIPFDYELYKKLYFTFDCETSREKKIKCNNFN